MSMETKKKSIIRLKGKTNPAAPANTKGVCFDPFFPFSIFAWKGALKTISFQENDEQPLPLTCKKTKIWIKWKLKWHFVLKKRPRWQEVTWNFWKRKMCSVFLNKTEGQLCMLSKQNQTLDHSLHYAISRKVLSVKIYQYQNMKCTSLSEMFYPWYALIECILLNAGMFLFHNACRLFLFLAPAERPGHMP